MSVCLSVCFSSGFCLVGDMMIKWEKWLTGWVEEGDKHRGVAELLVMTITLAGGHCSPEELVSLPSYARLSDLCNEICILLGHLKSHQVSLINCLNWIKYMGI